jgi:competence protein ComEC
LEAVALGAPRRVPAPPRDPLSTLPVGDRSRLEVVVSRIRDLKTWRPAGGCASLVVEGHLLGAQAGDRLLVFGRLAANRRPANPGEFDIAAHRRAERCLCEVRAGFPEAVTVIASGPAWSARRAIDHLRAGGAALLRRDLEPRRARLASAMFLGVREELDPEESQAFLETGTIHLLVISGLNVGILAGCLLGLVRVGWLPRRCAMLAIVGLTLLYAVVTGAQPPVVRSTIVVIAMCGAWALGRRPLQFNVWAAAGLVVLALNPCELFRPGTQLSFLCVAVLIALAERVWRGAAVDPLDRLIAASFTWPERLLRHFGRAALRVVVDGAVIWLVVCPLVAARFHLVSPAAVVVGPLVAIPVTVAMGAGFGVFAFGPVAPLAAALCGRVCDWNLGFVEWLVATARGWPAGHFWVAGPADWWLAGFYAALAVWLVGMVRPPGRWCLALMAGWCAVGLGHAWAAHSLSERLECTVVSVGHGSAVVVQMPGGRTLLYDAGRLGSPLAGERAIAAVLWSKGIRHLDAVVLSHADVDHYNAMPGLVQKFSVGVVYVSPVMFEEETAALKVLRSSIERAGVPIREMASGDRLRAAEGCQLDVMHPPRKGVLGSDNANSIVLAIEYQGRRILLTGDLESPGLDDVLADEPYDCDILVAPHHGSRYSDPPGIARWCTPEWVVISGGEADRWPTVERAYADRGSVVLHTATTGAVGAQIRGGKLAVAPWRP